MSMQQRITLDDIKLLDLTELDLDSEEDRWLYRLPGATRPMVRNSYDWVREEFNEISKQRRSRTNSSLLLKLGELKKNRFLDTHNIDTRTFTRPKRSNRKINDALQNGSHISDSDIDFSKTYTVNKLSSEFSKLRRTNPDEYLSNGDGPRSRMAYNNGRDDSGGPALSRRSAKMEDVNDVHLLAKMQEENLRMSYGIPHRLARRTLGQFKDSSMTSVSSDFDPTIYRSTHSSPGRSISDSENSINKSTGSLTSASSSSGSPQDTAITVTKKKSLISVRGSHKRSLPNLSEPTNLNMLHSITIDTKLGALSGAEQNSKLCSPQRTPTSIGQHPQESVRSSSAQSTEKTITRMKDQNDRPATSKPTSGIPRPTPKSSQSRTISSANGSRSLIGMKPVYSSKISASSWREGCF